MSAKTYFESPIGCLEIVGNELGLQSVKRVDKKGMASGKLPQIVKDCKKQLAEYFAGKRKTFGLKYNWGGATDFNQSVWAELLKIPYGHTTNYATIAEKINNPKAVRAVGMANRNNPIAIIVPCHRVIAKSGQLQGYFYGLDVKRQLLQLENPMSFATQGTLF